jgi:hypothetical protein
MNSLEDIFAWCDRAELLAPKDFPPTLPASAEILGAPEWYAFEHKAWPLGEKIRQAFSATRQLRKNEAIQDRIMRVVENRNLRRGRQSFVMALAHSGAAKMSRRLVAFLDDPDIDGHIVDALLKMRSYEFTEQVRPLLKADQPWIRRKATQYLEKARIQEAQQVMDVNRS